MSEPGSGEHAGRTVLLLRHGEASSPAGVVDRERPLSSRGRADCVRSGELCRARGLDPDLAVVSPARRARESWDAFLSGQGGAPQVRTEPGIYANTVDDLLAVLRSVDDAVRTVLLVGHNPSVGELANGIESGDGDPVVRQRLARGYPTAALAVFEVAGPWADLAEGRGRVVDLIGPG